MQTRSNSGFVEDPASGQALGGDNGSAKDSSHGTISETLQRLAKDDAPPVGKGVRFSNGQEAFENPSAMGAENPMKVDALSDNEESGKKNEIAAEIRQLKKEQKAQMGSKLRHLKEHKTQRFVKNILEQKSYV